VLAAPQSRAAMRWMWDVLKDDCSIDPTECRIVYVIEEEPEGSSLRPTQRQLTANEARFRKEMEASSPKVIVPLGPDAFRAVTGKMDKNVGIEDARGYCIDRRLCGKTIVPVRTQVGTYATSNKSRGITKGDPKFKMIKTPIDPPLPLNYIGLIIPAYSQVQVQKSGFKLSFAFKADLIRAGLAARGRLKRSDEQFWYHTDLNEPRKNGYGPQDFYTKKLLAFDIETLGIGSDVVDRISFSDGTRTHTLPWTLPVKQWVQAQFDWASAHGIMLVAHNSMFDIPRLKMAGIVFDSRLKFYDTMLAGVMLQPDLPKGLGRMAPLYLNIAPWKWRHLSEANPELYSALDSYITALLALEQIEALKELEMMVA
jgi:hypothetical protein